MKNFMIENDKQLVLEIVTKLDASSSDAQTPTMPAQHVARVPLGYSHFQLARDETWWWGVRRGRLLPDLDSHAMRVIPGASAGVGAGFGMLEGYTIELTAGARSYRRAFSNRSMASVANRKIMEVVKTKESEISLDAQYSYYITTVPADADDPPSTTVMNVNKPCREPLVFQHAPLAAYMAGSKPLQGVSEPPQTPRESPMPIFVTAEVWQESKEHAHRGGEQESAALFSGRLFRDTASDEVFLRIDACLEAAHAVEEKLAVTFTGETWAHARELLELRRRRLNRPDEMIIGSVHRHPFLPEADANGNRKCQACTAAKYCSRSTAVPSTDDFEWHRSVFSGQPYCILLIWGYTAREEEDFRLYGLENASFKERNIRLLTGNL